MSTQIKQKLSFQSRPMNERIAGIPMRIAIGLAWGLVVLGVGAGIYTMFHNAFYGATILLVALAFAAYVYFVTGERARESRQKVELVIDGNHLHLTIFDPEQEQKTQQSISLTDVSSAEYYPARDVSSLLLHGKTHKLDIPLWAFGQQSERKIVHYVRSHDVKIITIPDNIMI